MRYSFPAWDRDLQERVNASGGEGMPGIVQNFELFNRGGMLAGTPAFLGDLRALVERHEALALQAASVNARLATLRAPELHKEGWRKALHEWMKVVLEAFLGFAVEVPPPPALDRRQRGRLRKYGFRLFFVPAITEDQYPAHMVAPVWGKLIDGSLIQHIPLPGRWVAIETINRLYPDDRLMREIAVDSRYGHPYSGKDEGDDLVETTLPKAATILCLPSAHVQLPTVEIWNFLANLMNWLRKQVGETLPDLVANHSAEWCANKYGSNGVLVVGNWNSGGLSHVSFRWRVSAYGSTAFRILVDFPTTQVLPAAA